MTLFSRFKMLLMSLWIQTVFVVFTQSKDLTVSRVSKQDVMLLKEEQEPKCFTRTGSDFTCFFESADNRSYDFFYRINSMKNRCDTFVRGTEKGTFLYICLFPATDVFLFVETHLEVVDVGTNSSLYSRNVSVEDHFLLNPPTNVSLHQHDGVGQLMVSWHADVPTYCGDVMYRVRYSSKSLGVKTVEVNNYKNNRVVLDSLVPGEETEVQLTVKCFSSPGLGHWSSWSHPGQAMVPQSADDNSLVCYTPDLQNVTCQWNSSRNKAEKNYNLYYKKGHSKEWVQCPGDENCTDVCQFHGDDSKKLKVKLSSSAPQSRTFFTEEFTLNQTIKTSAPGSLRGSVQKENLCLKWEAPLPALTDHLQYEVVFQTRRDDTWRMVFLQGPDTGTCVEVPPGSQYRVKVRAKPSGYTYSGFWSDWSDELTGHTPTDTGLYLILCVPVFLLITAFFLISAYLSKLKHYFWPPVPDLDKVFQGFLSEIQRQTWDPPLPLKQWPEESAGCIVEIISGDGASALTKPSEKSTQPMPLEGALARGQTVRDASLDYVTLNKDTLIVCSKRNNHVYEKIGEEVVPPCYTNDFMNCSYLPLALESGLFDKKFTYTKKTGNVYTNLPSVDMSVGPP